MLYKQTQLVYFGRPVVVYRNGVRYIKQLSLSTVDLNLD